MNAAFETDLFVPSALLVQPDRQIRAEADRELLLLVLRAGQRSPFTSAAAAALIASIMCFDSASDRFRVVPAAVAWLGAMLLMLGVNAWYATVAVRTGLRPDNRRAVAWTYGLLGSATAMTWGASLWLFTPGHDPLIDNVLVAALGMVLSGGTVAQAAHSLQVRLFVYPLAVTSSVALLRSGDPVHMALACGFPLMAFHMMTLTGNFERFASDRLQLSMLNERLVRKANDERQAAEQARLHAEAMQAEAEAARQSAVQAALAKSNFITATSHDLRQPLHALVQYVADLKALPLDPTASGKVDRIDHAVSVLSDLLDAVLDFSRVAAGDLRPHLRAIDLPTLLASVESQTLPAAQAKGLRLSVRAPAGFVLSDEALLLRLIGNVAHNAVRYTAAGAVVIRARRVRGAYRVLVADSGIGIPCRLQARVFDEYFQVDNPERDRRKGLGIGLSIVRDLGKLLDLRIRLRSKEGRGTVFAIDVPEARVPPRAQDGAEVLANDYVKGALVLLIDDDPLARDGMASTLLRFGCRVLAAASGDEAVRLLGASEFVPQVILSDLRLAGGVNGARLAADLAERQAQALGAAFRPWVLVVTGDTQLSALVDARGAAPTVLKKPVQPDTLYATLNVALMRAAITEGHDPHPDRR